MASAIGISAVILAGRSQCRYLLDLLVEIFDASLEAAYTSIRVGKAGSGGGTIQSTSH